MLAPLPGLKDMSGATIIPFRVLRGGSRLPGTFFEKLICRSGSSRLALSDPPCENISVFQNYLLAADPNHFYISEIQSHSEGRCATSTARDGDAVDADAPIDDSARMRTAKTCGPDAPMLASSSRSEARATVARKPDRKSTRLNSSHLRRSRMPSSA